MKVTDPSVTVPVSAGLKPLQSSETKLDPPLPIGPLLREFVNPTEVVAGAPPLGVTLTANDTLSAEAPVPNARLTGHETALPALMEAGQLMLMVFCPHSGAAAKRLVT